MWKRKIRHYWQEVVKRSAFIFAALLISVAVFMMWFLITGFSQSQTTISIGIAAISTFFAAISSVATLLQATEAQRLRESQERPYVIASFEGTNRGVLYFEIQNVGNSPAVDLTFSFEPEPTDYAGRKLSEVSLFQKPISFLPQGKAYRQVIDISNKFLADSKPTKFKVTIVYSSTSGQMFNGATDYDLAYLKQATLPSKNTDENLEDISKQLKDIASILSSVKGMDSLLIETPDEYHERLQALQDERKNVPGWKILVRRFLESALELINK